LGPGAFHPPQIPIPFQPPSSNPKYEALARDNRLKVELVEYLVRIGDDDDMSVKELLVNFLD